MTARHMFKSFTAVVAIASSLGTASAQQVTGALGSRSATTTLDGERRPRPDLKFGGGIKEWVSELKAWWAPRIVPPRGALCAWAGFARSSQERP
jgi:hypothetical protein